jgi:hypothetical protein
MEIADYVDLIREIPLLQESYTTRREVWEPYFGENETLAELFGDESRLEISQAEIFAACNAGEKEKLFYMTILWAFPYGLYKKDPAVLFASKAAFQDLLDEATVGVKCWAKYRFAVEDVYKLGISAYSKLLYFSRATVEGMPAVKLDKRILDVLQSGRFKELRIMEHFPYFTAFDRYADYLEMMQIVAEKLDIPLANMVKFLSDYGLHLKA